MRNKAFEKLLKEAILLDAEEQGAHMDASNEPIPEAAQARFDAALNGNRKEPKRMIADASSEQLQPVKRAHRWLAYGLTAVSAAAVILTVALLIGTGGLRGTKPQEPVMPAEQQPTVIVLTPPKYISSWTWQTKILNGEFCPRNVVESNLNSEEHRHIDNLIHIKLQEQGNGQYYLDEELYYAQQYRDPNRVPWGEAYGWWVDRSFFYQYATTNEGGSLYRNMNTESLEVVVYVTADGEERLLFKNGSPLARSDTLRIQDFGVVVIDDIAFAIAEDYASVLNAHTRGTNKVQGGLDTIGENYVWDLNFECTTVPGLRYELNLIVDSDNKKGYVYAVNMGEIVSFELDYRWGIPVCRGNG